MTPPLTLSLMGIMLLLKSVDYGKEQAQIVDFILLSFLIPHFIFTKR